MGTYVFRWPYEAKDVHVTGTFDDWGKTEQLNKVGDHWEKEVQLPSADHKIYYKFVVDDQWIVDDAAPKEDDGHYNVNNVLLPEQINRTRITRGHRVVSVSSGPPGTSSRDTLTEAPTFSAPTESAPTLSLEDSEANASRWIPHVDPPADFQVTRPLQRSQSNIPGAFPDTPANEPESFGVAPIPATGHDNIQSTVTTSKEDFEKAGEGVTAAEPEQTVSVNPIPATGHDNIQSTVTTSKEDFEKAGEGVTAAEPEQTVSVNPIPATGHDNIQSSVTTSKEDYEKGGYIAGLGAAGAAGAAVIGGAAAATAFSKPSEDKKNIIPESSLPMDAPAMDTKDVGPIISSSGPGTTTADLASKVPLEPKREATVEDSSPAAPFISSSGPGTTTAALASQVPLEQKRQGMIVDPADAPQVPSEIAEEKSAVEKELLGKVPESEAKGEPASAAAAQSSYYGLATSVPETVEESMAKAHAPPEAASSTAVVAEKTQMERELLAKVPSTDQAGEPAPTIAAATSTTAPAATVDAVTDGKTANETVPDTDTSTATSGPSAGALAGGAVAGGAAVAGVAALASHHKDADTEPPRVADSSKPDVTSEAAPATQLSESKVPGTSSTAAAQVADGAEASAPSAQDVPKTTGTVDKSEGAATEYAPVKTDIAAPGVPSSAAAALSDGTEDPTLADEPAVKMMAQNEGAVPPSAGATTVDPADAAGAAGATVGTGGKTASKTGETAAAKAPETPKKAVAAATGTTSTASTPAKQTDTAASSPADTDKKKKKNRLSRIWHKIVD